MMRRWLIGFIFMVCMGSVLGVVNDSDIGLRASCIDAYGNLCTDTAYMTVIDSENLTQFNNTECVEIHEGIYDCQIKLNKTGLWFAQINFTNQNVSREYNIVVEEDNMSMVWLIPVLLGLVIIMATFYMVSLKLNKEHVILAVFFFMFAQASLTAIFYVMMVVSENALVSTVLRWFMWTSSIGAFVIPAYFIMYITWDGFRRIVDQIKAMG